MEGNSCRECRFAIFQDYGYSNYTVEGTELHCAQHAVPDFEVTFEDDKKLFEAATSCGKFEAGKALNLDVEGEEERESLSPDQKAVLEMYRSKS